MRRNVRWAGLLALGVGAAWPALGQGTPRQDATAPPRPRPDAAPIAPGGAPKPGAMERMDTLLQHWARRSTETTNLDAKFTRVDVNQVWNLESRYEGRAILVAPDRAFLSTEKAPTKPGQKAEFHERIISDGRNVYHYVGATKQIFIYPLDRQNQKRALEEGPLPFLFNMNVQRARERYQMHLLGEDAEHYQVRIIPKLKIDRDSFLTAEVWLGKRSFLPSKLVLTEPNGKDTQTYLFRDVRPNVEFAAENFEFRPLKGWKVTDNRNAPPGDDAPAQKAAAPAARATGQPGQPPAQEPAVGRRGLGGLRRPR